MKYAAALGAALALGAAACSTERSVGDNAQGDDGTPADVAGSYTVTATAGKNGCALNYWTEGNVATNITVTITQSDDHVTAQLTDWSSIPTALLVGSSVFEGTVKGDALDLTDYGSIVHSQGDCAYTYNATIQAKADGDFLSGNVVYSKVGNGNPDCASVECSSEQTFNGTRPAREP